VEPVITIRGRLRNAPRDVAEGRIRPVFANNPAIIWVLRTQTQAELRPQIDDGVGILVYEQMRERS
jgi:hypothetical protein